MEDMSWEDELKKLSSWTAALNAQTQRLVVVLENAPPEIRDRLKQTPDFGPVAQDFKARAIALKNLGDQIEAASRTFLDSQDRSASQPS